MDPGARPPRSTPRTRAVLAVHLFGRPAPARASCPSEVPLLEDAAGALGARRSGGPCGGARRARLPLLPPAQDRHDRRGRRGHDGRRRDRRRDPAAAPPRDRAARRLRHARRRPRTTGSRTSSARSGSRSCGGSRSCSPRATRIAAGYTERLAGARRGAGRDEGDRHGWQAYVVQLDRRDEALAALRAQGIEAQIGTYALHRLAAYRDQGPFPGADARASSAALALPFHTRLTERTLDRVAEVATRSTPA